MAFPNQFSIFCTSFFLPFVIIGWQQAEGLKCISQDPVYVVNHLPKDANQSVANAAIRDMSHVKECEGRHYFCYELSECFVDIRENAFVIEYADIRSCKPVQNQTPTELCAQILDSFPAYKCKECSVCQEDLCNNKLAKQSPSSTSSRPSTSLSTIHSSMGAFSSANYCSMGLLTVMMALLLTMPF